MSAQWEVQKSIYTALTTNTTFMNLISNRLYDEPPTNIDYPYVVIGEMTETDDNRLNLIGYDVTATINIFTKPEGLGFFSAKNILNAMNNVLNVKKLPMETLIMVICKLDNTMTYKDGDKRVLSARYRILAHSDTNINI